MMALFFGVSPMRAAFLPPLPAILALFATFLPLETAMAQTQFPEADKLPSRPELPDPLVMFNGERVASREQWFDKRRPELKALFQHYMYGYAPPPAKITAAGEWAAFRTDRRRSSLRAAWPCRPGRAGPRARPSL